MKRPGVAGKQLDHNPKLPGRQDVYAIPSRRMQVKGLAQGDRHRFDEALEVFAGWALVRPNSEPVHYKLGAVCA